MEAKEIFFGSDRLSSKQEQIREIAMYPFAGIFTALANAVSFVLMDKILMGTAVFTVFGFNLDLFLILKQFVSWIVTILTAYTTNRIFVFRSHGNFLIELIGFAAARLSTFVIVELVLFSYMVKWVESVLEVSQFTVKWSVLGFDITYLYLVKIVNNTVLVAVNFIMSKWIVFKSTGNYENMKRRKGKSRICSSGNKDKNL